MTPPSRHAPPLHSLRDVVDGLSGVDVTLAGEEDVQRLTGTIESDGLGNDMLSRWSLITVRINGRLAIHALGDSARKGHPAVTSQIVMIDSDSMVVRTQSGSLYGLKGAAAGAVLPSPHLLALRATIVGWLRQNTANRLGGGWLADRR